MISDSAKSHLLGLVLAVTLAAPAAIAHAQSFDAVGPRARGLGGAFVAVADDATATWWNPAGLPGTLVVDGVVTWREGERSEEPADLPAGSTAGRTEAFGFAFSFPAAGLSYYRVRELATGPTATGAMQPSRQDQRTDPVARSLLTHHVGLSVAHSLGDAVVVGATGKLVVGEVSVVDPAVGAPEEILDEVAGLNGPSTTRGDLDAGVLVRLGWMRLGLAARNLTAPTFDAPAGDDWTVERSVRAGLAVVGDPDRAGRQPWLVAVDADLTRQTTVGGERRAIAAGAERWWFTRRLGLRGGVAASTVGPARPTVSGGASIALTGGAWVEVEATGGSADADRGWGLAAHVMF